MKNPKYLINIFYNPTLPSGQELRNINGVTHSTMAYRKGFFIASSPQLKISATGSSYTDALDNILTIMTSSSFDTPVNPPLNSDMY